MKLSDELVALAKKLSSYSGFGADIVLLGQAAAALQGCPEDEAPALLTVIPDAAVVDAAAAQEASNDDA